MPRPKHCAEVKATLLFVDGDERGPGALIAECPEQGSGEAAIHVDLGENVDGGPRASVYLSAIDAAILGVGLVAAAREAVPEAPDER